MKTASAIALCLGAASCAVATSSEGEANSGTTAKVDDPSFTSKLVTKKRATMPEVEPVVIGNIRFEPLLHGKARGRGQNGGDVVARDATSGAELWVLRVYAVTYAANMEADKQDNFISDLSAAADGRTLYVTDERGRQFRVDILTRSVLPVRP